MKYLPSWLPGNGWQETAKAYKKRVTAMRDVPYAFVRRQLEQQKHVPSYVSRLLEQGHVEPGSEEEIVAKWSAQSLYGGGAETVHSPAKTLHSCTQLTTALECLLVGMLFRGHGAEPGCAEEGPGGN